MGFRNNFIDGYFLTPVGPRQRTFAQWSLENTLDSGLRANQKQLQALRDDITSTFQSGISRLEQSQMQSAQLLQREIQYQADHIADAIDRGAADLVGAVQRACDYLGGQLCEVRWAIERQSEISREILQALLNSLDNTSRQYWEQGVKCFETAEDELARERFNRALDANRTNYFAYQYLGFIAVHEENSSEAIRNFDLARKFAESGYHCALALSHLARSYYAVGNLIQAIQAAVAATEIAPEHARFWYECAVFHVRESNVAKAIHCLGRAISDDWTYWSISVSDANLDPVRQHVERLLEQMRETQRVMAKQRLDQAAATLTMLYGMDLASEVGVLEKQLEECTRSYRTGTVFAYRDLQQPLTEGHRRSLGIAVKVLDKRMDANRSLVTRAQATQAQEVDRASSRVGDARDKLRRLEEKPSGTRALGFSIGLAAGFCCFLFLAFVVYGGSTEHVGIVLGVSFAVGFGTNVLFAVLLVQKHQSKISESTQQYERAKSAAESQLTREKVELENKIDWIKRQKDECQKAMQALGFEDVPHGNTRRLWNKRVT